MLLMAVESAAIPIPSEIIMPLAGWFLVRSRDLPLWWLAIAALLGAAGNLLGSLIAYAVGAAGGRPLLMRYGRYILVAPGDIDAAEAWFARFGAPAVFLGRLIPVIRTYISLPAGVARMPLPGFTLFTFAGSFLWSLLLVSAGYALGANYERVRQALGRLDLPIGLAILALIAVYVAWHIRHGRSA